MLWEYIKYALFKKRSADPSYLIFFVTNVCNSRCRHCFYWKELNTSKNELTLDEIESLSRQLKGLKWLSLSGGEPFLRKDIADLCRVFFDNTKLRQITIPTNGMSTGVIVKSTEKILKISPKLSVSVNLSLDGIEKTHDYIRGVKGSFRMLHKTFRKLLPLKRRYKNLSIRVNTTVCNKNIDEIGELIRYVKKNFKGIASHNFELMRGDPRDKVFGTPSPAKVKNLIPVLEKAWSYYSFFPDSKIKSALAFSVKEALFKTYVKILRKKVQPFRCYAGNFHMVLDPLGNVFFCEMLGKVGNIRATPDFNKVWFGKKAVHMRKFIKAGKCHCTHSCFQNQNLMFSMKNIPGILWGACRRYMR